MFGIIAGSNRNADNKQANEFICSCFIKGHFSIYNGMITKAQVKHIRSLEDKKNRLESGEFVVEGEKMVNELIHSEFIIKEVFALDEWILRNAHKLPKAIVVHEITDFELERISFLSSPNQVLAVVYLKKDKEVVDSNITLLLDSVQDPGNMGTIIRIADWFGISQLVCNGACADPYSPKVVQSSMGGIFRVNILFKNGIEFLNQQSDIPSYAASLNGTPLNEIGKIQAGIIVIGNESKGINEELLNRCTHNVTIPKLGNAESLNAAVATGIICHSLLC